MTTKHSPDYSTNSPWNPPSKYRRRLSGRRALVSLCAFFSILTGLLFFYTPVSSYACPPSTFYADLASENDVIPVVGNPADRFRDSIRNDTKYITSWVSAGWTNDVMTYGNLIYLGLLTHRVPVIPPFTPSGHLGQYGKIPSIPFGDIFDVPRLRATLGTPVIEWRDLKDPASTVVEDIGCWNVWESVQYNQQEPRHSNVPDLLKLDISYTRTPEWVKLIKGWENDQHSSFWALAALAFPETRRDSIGSILSSPLHGATLEPDEHMLCYDFLYFATSLKPFEWETDYNPMWREVVQHFRWAPRMEDLARQALRRTFNLANNQDILPFITIHARHSDFAGWCDEGVPPAECFASPAVFARRVDEVRAELRARRGIHVSSEHVVMTSDEKDGEWWAGVFARGWKRVDYEDDMQAKDALGPWHALLIDAVVQSMGMGFVGTDRSTMSMLAWRRVQTWNDGAVRNVKWGRPNADAH